MEAIASRCGSFNLAGLRNRSEALSTESGANESADRGRGCAVPADRMSNGSNQASVVDAELLAADQEYTRLDGQSVALIFAKRTEHVQAVDCGVPVV